MTPGIRPLSELDDIEWGSLHACFGTSEWIPSALRDASVATEPEALGRVWADLYQDACHQAVTVYEVTSAMLPFVAGIAASPAESRLQRQYALGFLSAAAMAWEFRLPGGPTHRAGWRRRVVAPNLSRDFTAECRASAGSCVDEILSLAGPSLIADRCWYVALAASTFEFVGPRARGCLLELPRPESRRLIRATEVLDRLLSGARTDVAWLEEVATLDESVQDTLSTLLEDGCAPDDVELARRVSYDLAAIECEESPLE